MASITQWFLVLVSTVSARNAWHNDLLFVSQIQPKSPGGYFQKNWVGVRVQHSSWKPYPISDQNLWVSLPYFRPDQKFDTYFRPEALEPSTWPEPVTSCYSTYIQDYRVHKPYPISDQNGRNWYPISDQNGWKTIPFGTAHTHIAYIRDYPPPPPGEKRVVDFESHCLCKRD